jgi:hypothetical protein
MKTRKTKLGIGLTDQEIVDLWQQNVTAQQIADDYGITKNAVIGRVTRLRNKGYDLRKREHPARVGAMPSRTSVPKPMIAWVPLPPPEPVDLISEPKIAHVIGPKGIMDLKMDDCRYIINDGPVSSFLFCGEPKAGRTYCAAHHKLCYVRPPSRVKGSRFSLKKLTYQSSHHFKDSFI